MIIHVRFLALDIKIFSFQFKEEKALLFFLFLSVFVRNVLDRTGWILGRKTWSIISNGNIEGKEPFRDSNVNQDGHFQSSDFLSLPSIILLYPIFYTESMPSSHFYFLMLLFTSKSTRNRT